MKLSPVSVTFACYLLLAWFGTPALRAQTPPSNPADAAKGAVAQTPPPGAEKVEPIFYDPESPLAPGANAKTSSFSDPLGAAEAVESKGKSSQAPDTEPRVFRVRNLDTAVDDEFKKTSAGLNDPIYVDVRYLEAWIEGLRKNGKLKGESVADLVPFLNGIPISGVHPENSARTAARYSDGSPVHHLRFTLTRYASEESKAAWSKFLNKPVASRPMVFSIGFENVQEMTTWVDGYQGRPNYFFSLIVLPPSLLWSGAPLIVCALAIFIWLAAKTDIVRDTTAAHRPDGRSPFSLGRMQMAFWFFLVISSYFLLWMVTGDTDTLNSSVLGLIGISAGTALSGAMIDAGKTATSEIDRHVAKVDPKARPAIKQQLLREQKAAQLEALAAVEARRAAIPASDEVAREVIDAERAEIKRRIASLKHQITFFGHSPWRNVFYDMLGEDNVISFHRFQIFVWTFVLGLIFVYKVYNELKMPDFSATMLGLLGISAGTYIGFKFPENKT